MRVQAEMHHEELAFLICSKCELPVIRWSWMDRLRGSCPRCRSMEKKILPNEISKGPYR